jgi:hypothetical protein
MFTILKCGAQGVQEHRVHNTTFEVREHYCFMSNDHFNLAKVMEGPCCGQRAFGIGSNKEKITRACRIALAVHGVGRAVANAPSSLAPLLAIVGNEFSREFASESDSNHTIWCASSWRSCETQHIKNRGHDWEDQQDWQD